MGEPGNDEHPPDRPPSGRPRHRVRWTHLLVAALALLAASEVLWRWQTWPVRALLDGTPTQEAGAAR